MFHQMGSSSLDDSFSGARRKNEIDSAYDEDLRGAATEWMVMCNLICLRTNPSSKHFYFRHIRQPSNLMRLLLLETQLSLSFVRSLRMRNVNLKSWNEMLDGEMMKNCADTCAHVMSQKFIWKWFLTNIIFIKSQFKHKFIDPSKPHHPHFYSTSKLFQNRVKQLICSVLHLSWNSARKSL